MMYLSCRCHIEYKMNMDRTTKTNKRAKEWSRRETKYQAIQHENRHLHTHSHTQTLANSNKYWMAPFMLLCVSLRYPIHSRSNPHTHKHTSKYKRINIVLKTRKYTVTMTSTSTYNRNEQNRTEPNQTTKKRQTKLTTKNVSLDFIWQLQQRRKCHSREKLLCVCCVRSHAWFHNWVCDFCRCIRIGSVKLAPNIIWRYFFWENDKHFISCMEHQQLKIDFQEMTKIRMSSGRQKPTLNLLYAFQSSPVFR